MYSINNQQTAGRLGARAFLPPPPPPPPNSERQSLTGPRPRSLCRLALLGLLCCWGLIPAQHASAQITISGDTTGSVTEDEVLTATGTLTIDNRNPGGNTDFVAVNNARTTHGFFSITTDGAWTFRLNNASNNVQVLGAPFNIPTESVSVTAAADSSVTQTVRIRISGKNDVPVATINAPMASDLVREGATVTLAGTGTDVDLGDSLTYAWSASPDVGSFAASNSASTAWTAPATAPDGGNVTLTLTVRDSFGDTATAMVTVRVGMDSNDATLNDLTISPGNLNEAFDSATTTYTATVANAVASLTVTPTATDAGATITVDGTAVDSGVASAGITLGVGENPIPVVVTAEDGSTMMPYTITVTREAAAGVSLVTIAASLAAITEGGLAATLTLTVTPMSSSALTLPYTITGTGVTDADYTLTAGTAILPGAGMVQIPANTGSATLTLTAVDDSVAELAETLSFDLMDASDDYDLGDPSSAEVEIEQNGTPAVSVAADPATIDEGGASTLTLTVTPAGWATPLSVGYGVSGTGVSDADYGLAVATTGGNGATLSEGTLGGTVIIPAGAASGTVALTLTAVEDGVTEGEETLSMMLNTGTGYTVAGPAAAITINRQITFSGDTSGSVTEDEVLTATGTLTITSPGGNTDFVAVNNARTDLGFFSITTNGMWTFRLNNASNNVQRLTPFINRTDSVSVTAAADSSVTQIVRIRINGKNDAPVATINAPVAGDLVREGATVTLAGTGMDVDAGDSLTYAWSASPDVGSFAASNSASTAWTAPATAPDGGNVTLTLTVRDSFGDTATAMVTVRVGMDSNDATLNDLTISPGNLNEAFDSATTTYTATVANAVASLTVTPTATDAGATITVDGTAVDSGVASAGITLGVGENPIPVVVTAEDGSTMMPYTITVTREAAAGVSLVTIAASLAAITEGGLAATLTLTVTPMSSSALTLPYTITGTGVTDADYTLTAGTAILPGAGMVQIPANTGSATLTLTAVDDSVAELAETLSFDLMDTSDDYDLGDPSSAEVEIEQNGTPAVSVAADPATIDEGGASTLTLTVTPAGWATPLSVGYGVSGTGVSDADYGLAVATTGGNGATLSEGTLGGTVIIPAGAASGTVALTLTAVEDGVTEGEETLSMMLNTGTGYTVAGPAAAITINRQITFSGDTSGSVTEDEVLTATGTLTITSPGGNTDFVAINNGRISTGFVSITTDGTWTFRLNNASNLVQQLGPFDILSENFSVTAAADPSVTQTVRITINGKNDAPVATINAPVAGDLVREGETVTLAGTGTDADRGDVLTYAWSASPDVGSFAASNSASTTWTAPANAPDGGNVTLTLTVTDDSGVANDEDTAMVTVRVVSNDVTLSALTLSAGTLSPVFDSGTIDYTATVANAVASLTVTPTATVAGATITVAGDAVDSGTPSEEITLSIGENPIMVVVTAEDGSTETYTITVTRPDLLDLNGDNQIQAQDAQILYYLLLPSDVSPPMNTNLRALLNNLRSADTLNQLRAQRPDLDLNGNGEIDRQDARILYYVARFEALLRASTSLRDALLGDLVNDPDAALNDAGNLLNPPSP